MPPSYSRIFAVALALGALACRADASARKTDSANGQAGPQEPPIIAAASTPYHGGPVINGGTITGVVTYGGSVPADTTIAVADGQDACGDSVHVPIVARNGNLVSDALVWLEDIRTGKAVGEMKRWNVTQERCVLDPRVQAVTTGGTINVRNRDDALHRLRLTRQGTNAMLGTVGQSFAGQVVPEDTILNQVGLIEVRCEIHPWTQAWIAVLDHPYFAVSDARGAFTLDSVPAGTYTLAVWQPKLGKIEHKVEVKAGQSAEIKIELK